MQPLAAPAGPDDEFGGRAEEIRTLIALISKCIMRDLDRRLEASGAGISGPQFGVMRLLSQESATISELSSRLMLAPATLVPVVDTLERKGLVQRGTDPRDRRRVPLLLTDAGAQAVARVVEASEADSLAQALANLGAEKARQLHALLRELVNYLAADDLLRDRAALAILDGSPNVISDHG
jgi:DNA-binding MarR family transcriptional regulator